MYAEQNVGFYLPVDKLELRDKIKSLAKLSDRSMSYIIARLLEDALKER